MFIDVVMQQRILVERTPSGAATFVLNDVYLPMANALRRTLIADCATVAVCNAADVSTCDIREIPYYQTAYVSRAVASACEKPIEQGFVRFLENSTRTHNEILSQRFSMIPINLCVSDFIKNPSMYVFELRVRFADLSSDTIHTDDDTNNNGIRTHGFVRHDLYAVTTLDITFHPTMSSAAETLSADEQRLVLASLFSSRLVLDHVQTYPLLTFIGPGESLHVEFMPDVFTGKQHAAFSPVANCHYRALPVSAEKRAAAPAPAPALAPELYDAAFYFELLHTHHTPERLLREAVDSIIARLHILSALLGGDPKSEYTRGIDLAPLATLQAEQAVSGLANRTVTISVRELVGCTLFPGGEKGVYCNFGHTIGNLLQCVACRLFIDRGDSVLREFGYRVPYPLDGGLEFRVLIASPVQSADVTSFAAEQVRRVITATVSEVQKELRF